ncbi:MAG TPA: SHOCT domain-containing protein [Pyrinomonadaceae bacterium]|nr:SHOCT domain-containing protein [Pyrinomonadaceae bacterium]
MKPRGEAVVVSRTGDTLTENQKELTKATEAYKSSLRDLLVLRENKVVEETAQLEKLKELYRDGLISRREFEENERKLLELKGEVIEVQQKIKAADQVLAEALLESEIAAAPLASAAPLPAVSTLRRVAYIRYAGSGSWSLSEAGKVESFFAGRFGRHLPVSAYGQSELHNRWGYDHRNAMDVAVHPDSPEGQALMAYLSSQRIPFLAFRQAVAGSATGPHIHIGKPSSKNWSH